MPPDPGDRRPPCADDIAALAARMLAELPSPFAELVAEIPVRVQDWPDDATLAEMGLEDPLELTGLYRGVPVGQREGMAAPPPEPEMIFLYRLPILFEWCQRGCRLEEVVADVLSHEIGHHFGMDEAAARRLESGSGET